MNLFDKNENERDIIRELYQQPCKDYLVTFYYHKKGKPKEIQKFEFIQHDASPYFPRINRFFEFCLQKMKKEFNIEEMNKNQYYTKFYCKKNESI